MKSASECSSLLNRPSDRLSFIWRLTVGYMLHLEKENIDTVTMISMLSCWLEVVSVWSRSLSCDLVPLPAWWAVLAADSRGCGYAATYSRAKPDFQWCKKFNSELWEVQRDIFGKASAECWEGSPRSLCVSLMLGSHQNTKHHSGFHWKWIVNHLKT